MSSITWPVEGPEGSVWSHLQTGLSLCDEDLEYLPDALAKFTEAVGKALLANRSKVFLDRKEKGWVSLDEELLSNPWIRYAADLAIAKDGIDRATDALDRYLLVKPTAVAVELPMSARRYVAEVAQTYFFGFDPACIALCRAALEHLLKDRLVASGIFTAAQMKRDRLTAGGCLEKAKQNNLIIDQYDSAKKVIKQGDDLMHSHIADPRILRQVAADSVSNFMLAVSELFGGFPTFE